MMQAMLQKTFPLSQAELNMSLWVIQSEDAIVRYLEDFQFIILFVQQAVHCHLELIFRMCLMQSASQTVLRAELRLFQTVDVILQLLLTMHIHLTDLKILSPLFRKLPKAELLHFSAAAVTEIKQSVLRWVRLLQSFQTTA